MALTQYTNLDFDQVRASIKDYLRANSTFTDFEVLDLSFLLPSQANKKAQIPKVINIFFIMLIFN